MRLVPRTPRTLDVGLTAAAVALGAWCTQGVLDRVAAGSDAIRVAMLPSLPALAAAVLVAAALCFGVGAVLAYCSSDEARETNLDDYADWIKPLRGVALLALPYLPWLPDVVPLTQALAGPARWYVWAACLGVIVLRAVEAVRLGPRQLAALVGIATVATYALVAGRLGGTPIYPGGDEPHYLVITQSLLADGDLRIENNHDRGDYRQYFGTPLEPHYRTRGVDGEIYSIHPVGLPVLLAPIFALGGYWASVAAMVAASAAVAWLFWRRITLLVGSVSAGCFAWAVTFLGPPFVFNSFTIYPEIPAALVTALVFLGVTMAGAGAGAASPPSVQGEHGWRWWLFGVGIALLPWLSTKYAPMSAALLAVCALRAWPEPGSMPSPTVLRRWAALAIPYALSLVGWLLFFEYIWGSPWPSAPYGADDQTSLGTLRWGGPGLLFDQENGIAAVAPALLLAIGGFVQLFKDGGQHRRLTLEIAVVLGSLWATVGAFELWWGGTASVGRPVIGALGLLSIPVARAHRDAATRVGVRAAHYLLLILGLTNVVVLGWAQEGLLLAADRSGRSSLLAWLAPTYSVTDVFPSFIAQSGAAAGVTTAWWVLALAIMAWAMYRGGHGRFGARTARWIAVASATLACSAMAVHATVTPTRPSPLEDRARVGLLDGFDGARLPLALRYDPLTRVPPVELLAGVTLVARPTDRRERPPIPLLYNARFSLPAGQYVVELVSTRDSTPVSGERLSLQLGRAGPPAQEWEVALGAPGVWGRTFALPVDVGFVGFKATPALQAAGFSLRIRPIAVLDAHRRFQAGQVLSLTRYGPVVAAFADERAWPEEAGFWVQGGTSVRFVVSPDAPAEGPPPTELVLRVHSGEIPNVAVLAARGRAERIELTPKRPRTVVLPLSTDTATAITVSTRDYFVPSERDPRERDRRHLGCWVEIVGFEAPTARAGSTPGGRS